MNTISDLHDAADRLFAEYTRASQQVEEETTAIAECKETESHVAEAGVILQVVAQEVQQQAHDRIAGVVSRCLTAVFSDPYTFQIHFDKKRGRTEARLVFFRDGNEIHPTMGASGGVKEVAAFALRVACLMLTKPAPRKILFLDEPFGGVDVFNRPRVAELLLTLAEELGIQFVLVTHQEDFTVGTIVEI